MEVRNLIQDLAREHTIIFSTHILAEVTAVCQRVVIINKGKIRAVDTIENLERSTGGDLRLKLKVEGDMTKVSAIIGDVPGVKAIEEVSVESAGVNAFTVAVESEDVRKPLMTALISADCMVLEITAVHSSLEDAFVKITGTGKQSREAAFEELSREMDAQREAEEAARAADAGDGKEDEN